jgi:hypothetical protein
MIEKDASRNYRDFSNESAKPNASLLLAEEQWVSS